ncbi:MAG: hypothetical protein Q7S02_03705 [bacterium]|nr:hypothetical protein [bacterium]
MRRFLVSFRDSAIAVALMATGFTLAMVAPTAIAIGAFVVAGGAVLGAIRASTRDWQSIARTLLLALGVFGYPLFLGGRVLPWIAFVAHAALLVVGWHATTSEYRARIAIAQAFAAALAVSLSAAATQFFFPSAWRWVAGAVVALYLVLLMATIPDGVIHRLPTPAIGAIVLALSEGLIVLHHLPTHWVVNGTVLTLAFAAFLERERIPRTMFATLLLVVLLFGAFGPST